MSDSTTVLAETPAIVTTPNLDALRPTLLGMPEKDVAEPEIPAEHLAKEGNALAVTAAHDRVALERAGLDPAMVSGLAPAAHALSESSALLANQRKTSRTQEENELERQCRELRSDMLADASHATRKDPEAQKVLDGVREGEGEADLLQDLTDLAAFHQLHKPEFTAIGVDAAARAALARNQKERLEVVVSKRHGGQREKELVDLRNRAATHLSALVRETREVGAYVFRKDPERLMLYRSAYLARKRRKKNPV